MSAPHIPNLNTLRRGGPRSRGRGHGTTSVPGTDGPAQSTLAKDEVIQSTDNDAATSRLSAVEAGYLDDHFASLLTPGQHARRLPLMNRGTYARTTAIDRVVETFLDQNPPGRKQIVSLGAGSDTRYFRVRQRDLGVDLVYHEVDFAVNTRAKIKLMRAPAFVTLVNGLCEFDLQSLDVVITEDGSRLSSPGYHLHPEDLRVLPKRQAPLNGFDVTLPTLVISECCLVYLPPNNADAVLEYFDNVTAPDIPLAFVIYEPIRPNDAFGRTMVGNLTARGIHLQTLEKYATLAAQKARLSNHGLVGGAEAVDIDFVWRTWLEEKDRERVEGLEWMDEVEEFTLFAKHYCVAFGWRGFAQDDIWKMLPAQVRE